SRPRMHRGDTGQHRARAPPNDADDAHRTAAWTPDESRRPPHWLWIPRHRRSTEPVIPVVIRQTVHIPFLSIATTVMQMLVLLGQDERAVRLWTGPGGWLGLLLLLLLLFLYF